MIYTIQGIDLPDQFDAYPVGVKRYTSTPDAENYIKHWYQPTGKLKIPVLTLHTTRDPQVPVFHEEVYAAIVTVQGNSDFLYQLLYDRFGHINFTLEEHIAAFEFLVERVKTGDWGSVKSLFKTMQYNPSNNLRIQLVKMH